MIVLDGASRGEGAFAIYQHFDNATGATTRRDRVFAIAHDNSRGDIAHSNTREGDRVARLEVPPSAGMLAEYRDHERECRAFKDGPLNSKRMKHHRLSMARSVMTVEGHFILQYGEMRTSFRAGVQQRGWEGC